MGFLPFCCDEPSSESESSSEMETSSEIEPWAEIGNVPLFEVNKALQGLREGVRCDDGRVRGLDDIALMCSPETSSMDPVLARRYVMLSARFDKQAVHRVKARF